MNLQDIIDNYNETIEYLTQLSAWYNHSLQISPDILDYLTQRGLTKETIELFQLGYSPTTKTTLSFLELNELSVDSFISTGNFHSTSGLIFDKFQNRVVFPIFDLLGGVVGFSGRTLEKNVTTKKYINSPSSFAYKKSLSLYGLYQSINQIQSYDFAVVVEGNMDVCKGFQEGVDNIVAPCGTALRPEHLLILKHFTSNIVCCFDSDTAGQKAAVKARQLCKDNDCSFWSISLSGAKDPDEYIGKYGGEAFKDIINEVLKT